ncbi:MAG TPA: hypothetical protein VN368_02730 [Candidatus Methylomirabilis sp.]|nr:hypothetical protein [Candidatus Methylomirabilis sp.]
MQTKLEALRALFEADQKSEYIRKYGDSESIDHICNTYLKEGKKYTKLDCGSSGRLMITMDGDIYGIKAYGVIHKGHHYGNLDTINEWFWGEYYPVKKPLTV